MAPSVGDRFQLLADFGNQEFDSQGGVRHGLQASAVGTVVELVAAGVIGAHNDTEDAAVLEFLDESRSVGPDGTVVVSAVSRRIAFGVQQFDPADPNCLFGVAP